MKTNPDRTVLTIATGFILLSVLTSAPWLLYAALGVGLAGVFSGRLAAGIDYLWMKLAWLLGKIVPNLMLGLVYFLLLTPLALLSRVFRKTDPLILKNPGTGSVMTPVGKEFSPSSFRNPW